MEQPSASPFQRRRKIVLQVAIVGVAVCMLLPVAFKTKYGRWIIGLCIIRVVNDSDLPVPAVTIQWTYDGRSRNPREEWLYALNPGERREIWIWARQMCPERAEFGGGGGKCPSSVYAGSVFEIHLLNGGDMKTLLTH